jgi:hypothetical protein
MALGGRDVVYGLRPGVHAPDMTGITGRCCSCAPSAIAEDVVR